VRIAARKAREEWERLLYEPVADFDLGKSRSEIEKTIIDVGTRLTRTWASMIKTRDGIVKDQVRQVSEAAGPDTLCIVMMGANHPNQAEGFQSANAAVPKAFLERLPESLRRTLPPSSSQSGRAVEGWEIIDRDTKEMVLATVLQEILLFAYPELKQRYLQPEVRQAFPRAQDQVAAGMLASAVIEGSVPKKIEALFSKCVDAIAKSNSEDDTVASTMVGPIAKWFKTELTNPESGVPKCIGEILCEITSSPTVAGAAARLNAFTEALPGAGEKV
jgi:hypothetical protein